MAKLYNEEKLHELLYQALETEIGGVDLYTEAVKCAVNKELHDEWSEYLDQTRNHREVLLALFEQLDLDPETETHGRKVCRFLGESLVDAIRRARDSGSDETAQLVAAECIVLAETKDHLNWELIGRVGTESAGKTAELLAKAAGEVEEEEDHHLYHTRGFLRELWLKSLGLPAVIPPPEEVKNVKTAIGAARAEHARESML